MRKFLFALSVILTVAAVLAPTAFGQGADADTIAAITKLENDAVKADLANDASFYENYLADDWTGGTSWGTWDTKQSILADLKDPKNNKFNSGKIGDLKVRANGDVAVATYKYTYDALIRGKHRSRTVITTDVFQRRDGAWKQIADHSSMAAK